jgi:hypothetical protein
MDITLGLWILPVVLFVVMVILLLYLAILNYAPVRKEATPSAPRETRSSVMPVQNPVVLAPPPPPPMPVRQAPPQYSPPQYSQPPMVSRPPDSTELETMGKMIIMTGLEPREIPLPSAQFAIGRFYSPENNVLVAVDEKSVSRKHAAMRIAAQGREYYIQDVGSSYGTHLIAEGRFDRLTPGKEERVYNNDVIQFGSAVQVRLVLPCETRSAVTQL